jgi:hypothetical protein
MDTETLDKLYLEWSQFTRARTAREITLVKALEEIIKEVGTSTRANKLASAALDAVGSGKQP